MKFITTTTLPAAMRVEVVDMPTAEAFLRALIAAGLVYHFDDGAMDCLHGNGLVTVGCANFIDDQVQRCYTAWNLDGRDLMVDCPIGFVLREDPGYRKEVE